LIFNTQLTTDCKQSENLSQKTTCQQLFIILKDTTLSIAFRIARYRPVRDPICECVSVCE